MRVLLDECLPRRLCRVLEGHEVKTVPQAGLAGFKDGALIGEISDHFDAFITIDSNLEYQQNLSATAFRVIVLTCGSNRYRDLEPLVPEISSALKTMKAGELKNIGSRK
ncbi:DUF5615 family PIN-like protein [Verrucomicrobiales bacterium]|nr:DUF5615 family PIN-like protein [Verrucomicrobiales bacterium]